MEREDDTKFLCRKYTLKSCQAMCKPAKVFDLKLVKVTSSLKHPKELDWEEGKDLEAAGKYLGWADPDKVDDHC